LEWKEGDLFYQIMPSHSFCWMIRLTEPKNRHALNILASGCLLVCGVYSYCVCGGRVCTFVSVSMSVCYMNGQARFAIRQLYIGPKLLSFLLQDLAFVIYIYIPFFLVHA
jgi:hypothetical protein